VNFVAESFVAVAGTDTGSGGCIAAGAAEVDIDCIVGVVEVGPDIGCIAAVVVGDFVLDEGLVGIGIASGVGGCSCHRRHCYSQRCCCIVVVAGVVGGCSGQVVVVGVVEVRHTDCKKVVVDAEGLPLVE